ncbi:MAG TPA: DsbA family oxidoreductase [Thermohalobaculum sp.]|nr:DsbA family oxidoreductase [Thermohalobaculum sp.]
MPNRVFQIAKPDYIQPMITLDIISDPICPWCYIGKARLDQAIAETGIDPFDVSWRIFQLNPTMPSEGMDRREYLEAKFGGPEGAERVYSRVRQTAAESGLELDFDKIKRTPNTFDAHRLIRWAKATGNQTAVVEQLFQRYFENGEDISDHETLLDAAVAAGMERPVVAKLLAGDTDRDVLGAEEDAARNMGVSGVPCFVIGGRYVVNGAQDVATWKKIIAEIGEALAKEKVQADQQP